MRLINNNPIIQFRHFIFLESTSHALKNNYHAHAGNVMVIFQVDKNPRCPEPTPQSIMKPDIVFFGEGLPNEFHHAIEADRLKADLVIVMGSSLKVKPVAHIPNLVPPDIPQV